MNDTPITKDIRVNYRFHSPIIILLLVVFFLIPTISGYYYENKVVATLRNLSHQDGVYRFGEYTPLKYDIAPKQYLFVKTSTQGTETIENYYESAGHVTRAIYEKGNWVYTELRSYKEDYLFIAPVIGFIFIGFAVLSRTLRLLFTTKVSEFLWNDNDYWKYPYAKAEKIALLYGLPIFLASFFIGIGA